MGRFWRTNILQWLLSQLNHPATQSNVGLLRDRGAQFIGPDKGMLSCGYEGVGRVWPVEGVFDKVLEVLKVNKV